jgi:hypothetical protein
MYYEEKWINGCLHFKNTPDMRWEKCSVEQQAKSIEKLKLDAFKAGMTEAAQIDEIPTVEGYVYLEHYKQAILSARDQKTTL